MNFKDFARVYRYETFMAGAFNDEQDFDAFLMIQNVEWAILLLMNFRKKLMEFFFLGFVKEKVNES